MSYFTNDDFNEQSNIFNLTPDQFEFLAEMIAMKIVSILKDEKQAKRSEEELLTINDVVKKYNVSRSTLQRWEKLKYLLPVRLGKKVMYRTEDIKRAIA
jgi:predicted DNA-binding transcriptional regulator AlpA